MSSFEEFSITQLAHSLPLFSYKNFGIKIDTTAYQGLNYTVSIKALFDNLTVIHKVKKIEAEILAGALSNIIKDTTH